MPLLNFADTNAQCEPYLQLGRTGKLYDSSTFGTASDRPHDLLEVLVAGEHSGDVVAVAVSRSEVGRRLVVAGVVEPRPVVHRTVLLLHQVDDAARCQPRRHAITTTTCDYHADMRLRL